MITHEPIERRKPYDPDDPLNAARGIVYAVLAAPFVWIVIYLVYRYASAAGEVVSFLSEVQ